MRGLDLLAVQREGADAMGVTDQGGEHWGQPGESIDAEFEAFIKTMLVDGAEGKR